MNQMNNRIPYYLHFHLFLASSQVPIFINVRSWPRSLEVGGHHFLLMGTKQRIPVRQSWADFPQNTQTGPVPRYYKGTRALITFSPSSPWSPPGPWNNWLSFFDQVKNRKIRPKTCIWYENSQVQIYMLTEKFKGIASYLLAFFPVLICKTCLERLHTHKKVLFLIAV